MNSYKLLITSSDYYGHNFIDNIIKYAQKGAYLDKKDMFYNEYPHSCTMYVETEEFLVSEASVEVVPIREEWTKEGLDALDWERFKEVCKTRGLTGRNRDQMVRKFLEL